MRLIATRIPLLIAGTVLFAVTILLGNHRLEYCGQVDRPQLRSGTVTEGPAPTLAPPQKVVFIKVESDKPDLEISWAEN